MADKDEWCNFKYQIKLDISSKEHAYWQICNLGRLLAECQAQVNSVANKKSVFLKNKENEWLNLQVKTILTYFGCIIFDNLGPPLWEFCVADG